MVNHVKPSGPTLSPICTYFLLWSDQTCYNSWQCYQRRSCRTMHPWISIDEIRDSLAMVHSSKSFGGSSPGRKLLTGIFVKTKQGCWVNIVIPYTLHSWSTYRRKYSKISCCHGGQKQYHRKVVNKLDKYTKCMSQKGCSLSLSIGTDMQVWLWMHFHFFYFLAKWAFLKITKNHCLWNSSLFIYARTAILFTKQIIEIETDEGANRSAEVQFKKISLPGLFIWQHCPKVLLLA